ncbi:helix-turn-helix transcriptional regulator [Raoultibacter phocaeensis]|uniref:helix-turn-helix transcriptional regulator n=1 Tax=Raoultibacter phocaeensis TaxID=2479841 RepID=UPI0015D5F0C5|nr:YafY family protein [Raoultibacter phocaeensis]
MKIDRMFKIVYLLMSRDRVTVRELAERFEVSARTIHRDIDALMQAGIPLYTSRGSDGGVSLVDGFVLDKALLSEEEQEQVLLGLQSLPRNGSLDNAALEKLSVLFGEPRTDWIEVDFSRWGYKRKDDKRFDILRRAIVLEQAIRFRYANAEGAVSEREAHPLKLVFKSKAWYLQAFCLTRNDYRTFKVNRMSDIALCGRSFERSEYRVPELEAEDGPPPYELIALELVFEPRVASRVYDEFDIDAIETSEEGGLHVYTSYPAGLYLFDLLHSFGDAVTVLQPQSIRERLDAGRPSVIDI